MTPANNTITFELGDVAHDPHYNYTGIIIEMKNHNTIDYIILHDPNLPKEHTCSSVLVKESVNDLYPSYLQMVCKKADYEAIAAKKIFGHKGYQKKFGEKK